MSRSVSLPRPRKRFGQHFLHDPRVCERIVAALGVAPGDHWVEIGPGRGALTALLARDLAPLDPAASLDLIEIDRDLAARLTVDYAALPNCTIHRADVLDFDFTALAAARAALPGGGATLRVVGNLPYNISTPLLFHLLEHRQAVTDLTVMLQKEVLDRIVASPGTRDYGRLTIMLAPWIEAERLFEVGPGAFLPPPRVWSTVARIRVRPTAAFTLSPSFAKVVLAALSQRRKTVRNALRPLVAPALLERCGVDPGARPDTLAPATYGALARAIDGL